MLKQKQQKLFIKWVWLNIKTRLRATLLSLGLGVLLILFLKAPMMTSAVAQMPSPAVSDLRQWQQKLDQHRAGVSQQREQLQQFEGAAQNRLNGLRQNIQARAAQIKNNQEQIDAATQQLSKLEADLVIADKAHEQKKAATVARLRFLQRRLPANTWAALLQSQTLSELLNRRHQLKLVYQADQQSLVSLKAETERVTSQKQQIELTKNKIALLTQQLMAQKAGYESQAQFQEQLVNRLNTNQRALEAAEDQLERDSQSIALLIQRRLAERPGPGSVVVFGTGLMSYPSVGPVTSTFGWRVHPILGYNRFHSGVDFGAGYGTPIRAADTGTVIFAGWYGGYGNAVVVDHGKGIMTLYGHSSQLYVQAGQVVQRGQAIAAVGSTGLSTGPHLHFEVRQNGYPVDPLAYL
jgi:murein DD-endopeptidase MepM/ murein hydrolase activator NlpD